MGEVCESRDGVGGGDIGRVWVKRCMSTEEWSVENVGVDVRAQDLRGA